MEIAGSFEDSDCLFPTDDLLTALAKVEPKPVMKANSRKMSVKELKILRSEMGSTNRKRIYHAKIVGLWRSAMHQIRRRGDPWSEFHLDQLPVEYAKRYRYSPIKSKWVEDIVRVRMETKPFGRGAMRECFRTKKLSNFSHSDDWSLASNFVAKRYIEKVDPQVYFDDVRLQMDAKLWAEEFSRQPAVSKKVDIAQMCVLELINRPDKPMYHLEHFIEGTYRKYNSNSGFVDDFARNTPQAFSHFTFEQSGHHLLVVDIQGVGDLWTDPQIHTFDGKAYGDGNLGIRGMALFFHTHRCNPLCTALQLDPFDLYPGEQLHSSLIQQRGSCGDVACNGDSPDGFPIPFGSTVAIPRSIRVCRRQQSETDSTSKPCFVDPADFTESHSLPAERFAFLPASSPVVNKALNGDDSHTPDARHSNGGLNGSVEFASVAENKSTASPFSSDSGVFLIHPSPPSQWRRRKSGLVSESCSESDGFQNNHLHPLSFKTASEQDAELANFFEARRANHRSSSVGALRGLDSDILGNIHHELARMHAMGRFAPTQPQSSALKDDPGADALAALHAPRTINWEAAIFHEEQAALLQCLEAIQCLAQYYLGLEVNGPLEECPIRPDPEEAAIRGITLMSTAAAAGDRRAMIYLAEMNYTGQNPMSHAPASEPDWLAAVHWYEKAIATDQSPDAETECLNRAIGYDSMSLDWPIYRLHGRLGEMYAKGGHGLERDCSKAYAFYESAADGANEAMQGRLAMQYYDQAALLEEEFGADE